MLERLVRMILGRGAEALLALGLVLASFLAFMGILSLSFPQGMPAGLVETLAAENIYVAPRLGRLRISPHVYNDEEDADRFVAVLRKLLA